MIRTRVISTHRDGEAALRACLRQQALDPEGVYDVRNVRRAPNRLHQFLRPALVRILETSQ